MKSTYRKKMAEGGPVKAKSGKGYTTEQRNALARLLEILQPDVGDYTGEGVVTKEKPAQKKRAGGIIGRAKRGR